MKQNLSDSRAAAHIARAILAGFERHSKAFYRVTERAEEHFAGQNWLTMHREGQLRLNLYSVHVSMVLTEISNLLDDRLTRKLIWAGVKAVYSSLITNRDDWEIAETFYNSVCRRVFTTVGVDPRIEFVDTDFDDPPIENSVPIFNRHPLVDADPDSFTAVLTSLPHAMLYRDLRGDAAAIEQRIALHYDGLAIGGRPRWMDCLSTLFYRGRAAYIIGKLVSDNHLCPIVIALRNEPGGIYVDAVLLSEDAISILFGFTRSYFRVVATRPYDVVAFLKELLPKKRTAELYLAIGENRHGKTELYRDILTQLGTNDEPFVHAPGTTGMVMIVFTLPSYDLVFKVIRDRFESPKTITRETVLSKYRLVFRHDRAGRLIDAQPFEHLEFARDRFSEALLDELLTSAAQTVALTDDGEKVVIRHLYVERKVTPLNIYIRERSDAAACAAIIDWGRCIKELAISNIFPGDLLQKNFGVTRHGRVVFYDYDELCHLTDVRFLFLPVPRDDDEAMSPVWRIQSKKEEIFPAEFSRFLGLKGAWRVLFEEHHGNLYTPKYWRDIQVRLSAGELPEILPYARDQRLR